MESPKNISIDVDINIYADQLRGEICSDVTSLQMVTYSIENKLFSNDYTLQQGVFTSIVTPPPSDFLIQREINKCFKSIMGSFQDYMDKLIALMKLMEEPIDIKGLKTFEEVQILIQSKFSSHIFSISTDHSLSVPRKLEILFGGTENQDLKDSVQNYFDIRNGIEHHKGIAKKERVINYKKLELVSTSGKKIFSLPAIAEPGESILLKTFIEDVIYDKGDNLIITREQLNGIILNLQIHIIPILQSAVVNKINLAKQKNQNE